MRAPFKSLAVSELCSVPDNSRALVPVGLYKWHDDSIPDFDINSPLWCKPTTPNLGFQHQHKEPTRLSHSGKTEECALLRRGRTSTRVVCLDDVMCNELHPFICQRSTSRGFSVRSERHDRLCSSLLAEATALRYSGAPRRFRRRRLSREHILSILATSANTNSTGTQAAPKATMSTLTLTLVRLLDQ